MSQQFSSELTIYIWPHHNQIYPQGHAAFKVNLDGDKKFFNVLINAESRDQVDQLNSQWNKMKSDMAKYTQLKEARKSLEESSIEHRNVEHTAPVKIKLPFFRAGSAELIWGLKAPNSIFDVERDAIHNKLIQSMSRSSSSFVGFFLNRFIADLYVPPPYSLTLRWDTVILDRWARQVLQRIDDLNGKSLRVDMISSSLFTESRVQVAPQVMSVAEWRSLTDQYWGKSTIHTGRRAKMDRLLEKLPLLHTEFDPTFAHLIEILDICAEYIDTDYSKGDKTHIIPPLRVARQINAIVRSGFRSLGFVK